MKIKPNAIVGILFSTLPITTGCGGAPPEGAVIVTTEPAAPSTRDTEPLKSDEAAVASSALEARMLADQRRAAEILQDAMCQGEALAAIYALRLGIRHDPGCAAQALNRGIESEDVLVQALSWRWMIADRKRPLPALTQPPNDPVVHVLAALAYAVRGEVPNELGGALALSGDAVTGDDASRSVEKRCALLKALSTPYDDGPLSTAVAFVEARQEEWTEHGERSAARLREELLSQLLVKEEIAHLETGDGPSEHAYSDIGDRLDNRLVTRPLGMLRNIALSGPEPLRRKALSAIAVVALKPAAGDLGAAAAALGSPSEAVRLEGARTYLLLILRLRK